MTDSDAFDLQQLATLARRRAVDARALARDRRMRAASALAGRQVAYAQGLLDSACWLESAAEVEDRRAAMLEVRRGSAAGQQGAFRATGEGR